MKHFLKFLALFLVLSACDKSSDENIDDPIPDPPKEKEISTENALKWINLTLDLIKNTTGNSPTYTSRSMGLTMYESTVNGSIIFQSVAPNLTGLGELPKTEANFNYDWELVMNSAVAAQIRFLYPHATDKYKFKIDSLENEIIDSKKILSFPQSTIDNSATYGKVIAGKISEWSKTDGGFEGYMNIFDANYKYPSGVGFWAPPVVGQSAIMLPMHPHWGQNRTFIPANKELGIPEKYPFSKEKDSKYYNDMVTVYQTQLKLTQEDKEMALWWGDDPATSASPPGHSIYLTAKLIKEKQINLFEATSLFAKVGMAVADAFVNCWKCKYYYHAERPTPYIRRWINGAYSQFWPEPPFPAFTSGHSTQASATATALISVFDDNSSFVDDFHTGRPKDDLRNVEFKSRPFSKISDFAIECGYSRILGGIHTPQDNENGLSDGKKIGQNIVALNWKK